MNLVVNIDGQARSISGVTPSTTTTQLVYALAHSINQKGRFLLVAQLGDSGEEERRLPPNASPLLFIDRYKAEGVKISLELRKLEEPSNALDGVQSSRQNIPHRSNHHIVSSTIAHSSSPSLNSIASISSASSPSTISAENSRLRMKQALGADGSSSTTPTNPSPSSSNSTVRSRGKAPPPAYNAVLVEKFNSLTRARAPSDSNHATDESSDSLERALLERRLTETQLIDLVQSQREKQVCQREELSKRDFASEAELELLQLKKQHNNLQTVLNSLRNGNWSERLERERKESKRLQSAIDAVQVVIGERRRELNSVLETQRSLELQYTMEAQRQLPNGRA